MGALETTKFIKILFLKNFRLYVTSVAVYINFIVVATMKVGTLIPLYLIKQLTTMNHD